MILDIKDLGKGKFELRTIGKSGSLDNSKVEVSSIKDIMNYKSTNADNGVNYNPTSAFVAKTTAQTIYKNTGDNINFGKFNFDNAFSKISVEGKDINKIPGAFKVISESVSASKKSGETIGNDFLTKIILMRKIIY